MSKQNNRIYPVVYALLKYLVGYTVWRKRLLCKSLEKLNIGSWSKGIFLSFPKEIWIVHHIGRSMSQRHSTLLPAHLAVSSLLFPLSYHPWGHCLSSSFPWTLECQAVKPLKSTCIWKVFPVQPYYLNCLILGFISDNGSGFVPFERKRANDHSLLYLLWCVSPEELKACNLLYESVLFNQFIFCHLLETSAV